MSKSNNSNARAVAFERRIAHAQKRMFSDFAVSREGFNDELPASCARFAHDVRFTDDASFARDTVDRFSIDQYVP